MFGLIQKYYLLSLSLAWLIYKVDFRIKFLPNKQINQTSMFVSRANINLILGKRTKDFIYEFIRKLT